MNRRHPAWSIAVLLLSTCSSGSSQTATLTLDNPTWERVNVQAVITNSADCDNRGNGYVETKEFAMRKGQSQQIEVSHGEAVCWRHDRNPNDPKAGDWTDWSRATLFPGESTSTDL